MHEFSLYELTVAQASYKEDCIVFAYLASTANAILAHITASKINLGWLSTEAKSQTRLSEGYNWGLNSSNVTKLFIL